MISIETQEKLIKLFLALIEGERNIEASRRILNDNYEFDAFQIFHFLDKNNQNALEASNIKDYLNQQGVYCSLDEARTLILFYDTNNDGVLSYSEFLDLVKSEKAITNSSSLTGINKLSFNITYGLTKILEKEVNLIRKLSFLISELKLRNDFSIDEIFNFLKSWDSITCESIKRFLEKNNASCMTSDIKAIMKRLDFNKDGQINLCELKAFFGHTKYEGSNECSCYNCSLKYEAEDAYKGYINKDNKTVSHSLLKSSQDYPHSTNLSDNLSLRLSPERKFGPQNFSRSAKNSTLSPLSSLRVKSSLMSSQTEKVKFQSYVLNLLQFETTIEKTKINLAIRKDFNMEDAFCIFEYDNTGLVRTEDFKNGLSLFGVKTTIDEIRLLMTRFDLKKKGTLSYSDFFDMLVPFEKEYRRMIENRPPNDRETFKEVEIFLLTTQILIKNLFLMLLDYEKKLNEKKKDFSGVRCRLREIMDEIDIDGVGYFNAKDFLNYLEKNNLLKDNENEWDLVFIRFDKNRDGKVDYWELEDELMATY